MKKLLVSAFALAAFAGPGMAADLYTPSPAMYDWNGGYLGGHVGYLWGEADVTENGRSGGGDFDGIVGGIVGGWNFHQGPWVFGLEGDFGWTGVDGTGSVIEDSTTPVYDYDMDWNAHVRGRVGMTLGEEGRTLLFIAGGLAIADVTVTEPTGGWSDGGTFTGWSIGGGVNHAFSNNMIGGIEVLYDDYGSKTYTATCTDVCLLAQVPQPDVYSVDLDSFTVRGTLTYHFN